MKKNKHLDNLSDVAKSWERCIAWGLDHVYEPSRGHISESL